MLEEGGGRNAIDGLVDGALGKIDSRRDPERKTIVRIANRIRNGLKHLSGTDSLLFDLVSCNGDTFTMPRDRRRPSRAARQRSRPPVN